MKTALSIIVASLCLSSPAFATYAGALTCINRGFGTPEVCCKRHNATEGACANCRVAGSFPGDFTYALPRTIERFVTAIDDSDAASSPYLQIIALDLTFEEHKASRGDREEEAQQMSSLLAASVKLPPPVLEDILKAEENAESSVEFEPWIQGTRPQDVVSSNLLTLQKGLANADELVREIAGAFDLATDIKVIPGSPLAVYVGKLKDYRDCRNATDAELSSDDSIRFCLQFLQEAV